MQTSTGSSSFQGNEIWSCCELQSCPFAPHRGALRLSGLGETGIEDTSKKNEFDLKVEELSRAVGISSTIRGLTVCSGLPLL